MIRVVVADDQELVRAGFATLRGIQPGIEVVGTALRSAGVLGRRPGSRAAFLGVLVVAAVDVALLVASGNALR